MKKWFKRVSAIMIKRRMATLKSALLFVALNMLVIFVVVKFYDFLTNLEAPRTPVHGRKWFINRTTEKAKSCTPKRNVVFLKTHKTGGSTVTNILNRYGDENNLLFVVPQEKYNRLGWPWFFQIEHMMWINSSKPNILCSHARYNRPVLEKVMPNDTIYVTILRDPVTQFESTFSYMTFGEMLGIANVTDPLKAFFDNPRELLVNYLLTQDLRINSDRLKLIRNGMFFDLGLESKDFENPRKINASIHQIDREFDLVMTMERFDESLVLLKKLLCWDTDDLVYFRQNGRDAAQRRSKIPHRLRERIRRWSRADSSLYKHFARALDNKISLQPASFSREVQELRSRNALMKKRCVEPAIKQDDYSAYKDVKVKGYTIHPDLHSELKTKCERMTWNEVKYLGFLRYKQNKLLEFRNGSRNFWEYLRSWIKW